MARGIPGFPKHLLPMTSEFIIRIPGASIDAGGSKIDSEMRSLPSFRWHWRQGLATGIGFAAENVWSRQARRRRQKEKERGDITVKEDVEEIEAALGVKIQLKQDKLVENGSVVSIRWLKGRDKVLFESFCGMLKRKLEEA